MAGVDTTLAATALAIALVALVTALGQLLGQYFATADGYRRCQKSVMGMYSSRTRLHWRWREFRFETLYTTPEIFLAGQGAPSRAGQVLLTGSEESRANSLLSLSSVDHEFVTAKKLAGHQQVYHNHVEMTSPQKQWLQRMPKKKEPYRGDIACWIPFLHWVHEKTEACLDHQSRATDSQDFPPALLRLPAIIFRERSWDFQPPDIVRPLAKTTLSDIAVIARRMGMKWKDFRPSEGILRAEGHSQTITSTIVRSLGIVLQYSYTGQGHRLQLAEQNLRKRMVTGSIMQEEEERYIPRAEADRLGCGVLRGDPMLGLPDVTVSTQAEIVRALSYLDRSGTSSAALSSILKENADYQCRVADLVAFVTYPAHYWGSDLVQVPAPSDNVHGVTTSSSGRRAFRMCLEEYVVVHQGDVGKYTFQVLQTCKDIGTKYATWDHTDPYTAQTEEWVVSRDPAYLDTVHDECHELTTILNEWEQQHSFRYTNLLAIHIRVAMFAKDGETSMQRNWSNDYKADVDGYFRVLPTIVEEMRKTGFYDRQMIVDAWVMMMMRAFCCNACTFFVPGERVPIQYLGSQLPVFIG